MAAVNAAITAADAAVSLTHCNAPPTKPTCGPKAASANAAVPPACGTRLPATAKARTMQSMTSAHARYAYAAEAPSICATTAGIAKMPPPTVMLKSEAVRPRTPIDRESWDIAVCQIRSRTAWAGLPVATARALA